MAGQVTVSVKLTDGTEVSHTRSWSGGNTVYEGYEAESAGQLAAGDCRAAIEATHGTLSEHASEAFSMRGGTK